MPNIFLTKLLHSKKAFIHVQSHSIKYLRSTSPLKDEYNGLNKSDSAVSKLFKSVYTLIQMGIYLLTKNAIMIMIVLFIDPHEMFVFRNQNIGIGNH